MDLTAGTGPDGDDLTLAREDVNLGSGSDTFNGTTGANTADGGGSQDDLTMLAGADTVQLRDGKADTADCGDDGDIAIADAAGVDTLTACETVDDLPGR